MFDALITDLEYTLLDKTVGLLPFVGKLATPITADTKPPPGACLTKEVLDHYFMAATMALEVLGFTTGILPLEHAALTFRLEAVLDALGDSIESFVPHMAYIFSEVSKTAGIHLATPSKDFHTSAGTLSVFFAPSPPTPPHTLIAPMVMRLAHSLESAPRFVQCVKNEKLSVYLHKSFRSPRTGIAKTTYVYHLEDFGYTNDPWGVALGYSASGNDEYATALRPWRSKPFYGVQGPIFDLEGLWYWDAPTAPLDPNLVFLYQIMHFRTYVVTAPWTVHGYLEWSIAFSAVHDRPGEAMFPTSSVVKIDGAKMVWLPGSTLDDEGIACDRSADVAIPIRPKVYEFTESPSVGAPDLKLFDTRVRTWLEAKLAGFDVGAPATLRKMRQRRLLDDWKSRRKRP